jgi:hypothetical protein
LPLDYINNGNNNEKIHSERILIALTKLDGLLGKVMVEGIIKSLKYHGIDVANKSKFYSIADIQAAFDKMFGPDASRLLVERLKVELYS